jgi:LasA protease
VKPIFSLLALCMIFSLGACGSTPNLWGVYMTPTSDIPIDLARMGIPTQAPDIETLAPIQTSSPAPSNTPVLAPTASTAQTEVSPNVTLEATPILYYSQSGDTLFAVASHFQVGTEEISASDPLPDIGLIDPGTLLVIPDRKIAHGPNIQIMPDSEVVYSVAASDFDIKAYVIESGGDLSKYQEYLRNTGWTSGASVIERISIENSINPRLLLAILDYEGNWVTGKPADYLHRDYPMGYINQFEKGVFRQMVWAVNQLYTGYYGWRSGTLQEYRFPDGNTLPVAPDLNAGTVAVQYLFSKLHNQQDWQQIIDPNIGFPARFAEQFGDPWSRAQAAGPVFPPGLVQPVMVLPFEPKREWAFTGGPHGAWEHDGPLAAIDFAPSGDRSGCTESEKWLVASAPGLVVRSGDGVIVLDLDGDGYEETGWNLMYLHVATKDRVKLGTWVETDDRIGHASCEGGLSTGTHLHFARKYNGEWILADGPIPFNLSGYIAHNGVSPYEGTLTKGDLTIVADPVGTAKSIIFRDEEF